MLEFFLRRSAWNASFFIPWFQGGLSVKKWTQPWLFCLTKDLREDKARLSWWKDSFGSNSLYKYPVIANEVSRFIEIRSVAIPTKSMEKIRWCVEEVCCPFVTGSRSNHKTNSDLFCLQARQAFTFFLDKESKQRNQASKRSSDKCLYCRLSLLH